jgi:hypothetical protein
MVGRPSVKHARPVVLNIVNNGIGKSHARIVNNIAHGTRAGNVLCYRNISCKGSCDDQDRLPYLMDPHGITPTVRALLVGADPNGYARDASQDRRPQALQNFLSRAHTPLSTNPQADIERVCRRLLLIVLTLDGKKALKTLLAANKRLNTAYLLKESFGQLWDYEREAWAGRFFENWRSGLKWQRLKPYEKFAAMIERHWDGIAALPA